MAKMEKTTKRDDHSRIEDLFEFIKKGQVESPDNHAVRDLYDKLTPVYDKVCEN